MGSNPEIKELDHITLVSPKEVRACSTTVANAMLDSQPLATVFEGLPEVMIDVAFEIRCLESHIRTTCCRGILHNSTIHAVHTDAIIWSKRPCADIGLSLKDIERLGRA